MNTVVVGAGPAGVRAAQALVRYGIKPIVLDEAARWGGQIYRQQPGGFQRSPGELYGFEASRATEVHRAMAEILPATDYRPASLVWGAEAGHLDVLRGGRSERVKFRNLIIAAGATDRVLPFPGWTLPGVYTLGGAQVALKFQGCGIGNKVVFAGSGPLLYLVAYQYAKAGAKVEAVLDFATVAEKAAGVGRMLLQPAILAKGVHYTGWLLLHGIPVHHGARIVQASGERAVEAMRWHDGEREEHQIGCDAIGFGYGLRSETQLADLLDCRFTFNALQRAYLPEKDVAGRSSVQGVYLAGDGAGIQGADAAEWAGERAALALLTDMGVEVDPSRAEWLERKSARLGSFRKGLERAFPFPTDWASGVSDETVICRCEEITAGELRHAVAQCDVRELNRLKALTRVGMGRCQGRMCGVAAGEILAHATAQPVHLVGRLRGQAPIKPLPFSLVRQTGTEATT